MQRFRKGQTAKEQEKTLEDAVPQSTKYSTKWAHKIFTDWQIQRLNKDPMKEILTWDVKDISTIQDLSTSVEQFKAESLDFWLVKFIQK